MIAENDVVDWKTVFLWMEQTYNSNNRQNYHNYNNVLFSTSRVASSYG